jgi:type IV pilus assembly protein PilC
MKPAAISRKDVAAFARAFAVMANTSVAPVRALATLEQGAYSPGLCRIAGELRAAMEEGQTLSGALARCPGAFDPLSVSVITAGEAGGRLAETLEQLAACLDADLGMRSKVRGELTTLLVMTTITAGIVIGFLAFLVPPFAELYHSIHIEHPWFTRITFAASNLLKEDGPLAMVLLVFSSGALLMLGRRSSMRETMEAIGLRLPLVGPMLRSAANARFTRALGTTLAAGVPVPEALELALSTDGSACGPGALRSELSPIRDGVELEATLQRNGVLPPEVSAMATAGEEAGTIGRMLLRAAAFHDGEADRAVRKFTWVSSILLLVLLGITLGIIVAGIYHPKLGRYQVVG